MKHSITNSTGSGDKESPYRANKYEMKRLKLIGDYVGPGRILDIGYAQAPNPHLISHDRHVVGADILAPHGETGYDEHLQGDVMSLSDQLTKDPFDYIVAAEFIEHVEQPYDILRLFKSALKSNGSLILTTPNPLGFPVFMYEWTNSKRRFFSFDHTYYFLPRWMIKMLEDTGFRVEAVKGVGLWPLALACPATLSYQVLYLARPA